MTRLIWGVLVLNILDAVTTIYIIENRYGVEANPLMRYFYDMGVWQFVIAKFSLITTALYCMYRIKDQEIARLGMWFTLIIYMFVVAYNTIGVMIASR